MRLETFFISSTKLIFTKLINVSGSLIKIKARSQWAHFLILLTSRVICKQQFLYENEIVQYFKTANAIMLNKTILESPYEEL